MSGIWEWKCDVVQQKLLNWSKNKKKHLLTLHLVIRHVRKIAKATLGFATCLSVRR
jgi:hypothetical protein